MAELMIKIGNNGPDPQSRDGDVICAFTQRRIRCCHAQLICQTNMRDVAFTRDGLRPLTLLSRVAWFEVVSEFRFERVSSTEVDRVNISTTTRERLSNTPNAQGEYIHVQAYIDYAVQHSRHAIFGAPGSEIWYGGHTDLSNAAMSTVWAEIESRTPAREINYPFWPATPAEKRHYLLLRTNDFSESRANALVAPELDTRNPEIPVIVKKRQHAVTWRALGIGVGVTDIEDKTISVDVRPAIQLTESVIVARK